MKVSSIEEIREIEKSLTPGTFRSMYYRLWGAFMKYKGYNIKLSPSDVIKMAASFLDTITKYGIDHKYLDYWLEGWQVINYINVDAEANIMESETGEDCYYGFIEEICESDMTFSDFEGRCKFYFETVLELSQKDLKRAA